MLGVSGCSYLFRSYIGPLRGMLSFSLVSHHWSNLFCVYLFRNQQHFCLNMAATGFVGIGIMGEGMAARLLSEGVAGQSASSPLIIWNRTKAKCEALKAKFPDKTIIIKDTAKEVVESCTITYSILSTPEVSQVVFEANDGVLAGVSQGKSIVDCATLAEADMKRMSEAVVAQGG